MTSFHAFLGCSLDGFIAGPHGELDWLTVFDGTGFEEFIASIDALAMGRVTYDTVRGMDPDVYRGIPFHVLSTTMRPGAHPPLGRSSVTSHTDLASLRNALDRTGAERVYADGGRTVQTLLAAGLLTELTVTRVPVLLGEGIPLFGPLPGIVTARLVSSSSTDQGAVQSVYRFRD